MILNFKLLFIGFVIVLFFGSCSNPVFAAEVPEQLTAPSMSAGQEIMDYMKEHQMYELNRVAHGEYDYYLTSDYDENAELTGYHLQLVDGDFDFELIRTSEDDRKGHFLMRVHPVKKGVAYTMNDWMIAGYNFDKEGAFVGEDRYDGRISTEPLISSDVPYGGYTFHSSQKVLGYTSASMPAEYRSPGYGQEWPLLRNYEIDSGRLTDYERIAYALVAVVGFVIVCSFRFRS